jgi:isopentenyldiphosphate isomerase
MKQALTNNRYSVMVASGMKGANFALDLVDAVSFLKVVCPSLESWYCSLFNVADYTQLSPSDAKQLVEAYQKDIFPWFNKQLKELYEFAEKQPEPES